MAVKTWTTERVTSADINTYLTNSGLVYVTNGSFSSSATVSVSSVFTSSFTNYRVLFTIESANSTTTRTIKFRFRTSSGDDNTASYYYGSNLGDLGGTTNNQAQGAYGATEAIMSNYYAYTDSSAGFNVDVITPNSASTKSHVTGTALGGSSAAIAVGSVHVQFLSAKSHTGFSVYPSTGTISGTYAVYGYRIA